jgi:DNA-directed RNA polymerase subunit RPC12/RpoP
MSDRMAKPRKLLRCARCGASLVIPSGSLLADITAAVCPECATTFDDVRACFPRAGQRLAAA